MKKIILISLTLIVAIFLLSCAEDDGNQGIEGFTDADLEAMSDEEVNVALEIGRAHV